MEESSPNAAPSPRKRKKKRSKASIAKSKKSKEAPKGSWSEVSTIKAGGTHVKSRWKRQYSGPRVLSEDHLAGDGEGWMPTPHVNVAVDVENQAIHQSDFGHHDVTDES